MRVRPSFFSIVPFLWILLSFARVASAQSSSFGWSFGQDVGTSLTECATLPITITSKGANGASYYMIALATNGVPTTSLVGTTGGTLSWVVNQPAGTSVLLYLLDGAGNSGTIPPTPYTVTGGQSSQCLPSSPNSSSFTVTPNVTEQIATCDLWQLVVRGGSPPYNVLLASPGASSVTNVTLPAGSNMYTYVNRAAPQGTLLAAVSDSKGAWAKGTPYVITTGSNDTTCGGLTSFSGVAPPDTTSTTSNSSTSTGTPNTTSNRNSNKTPIIAGVCGALGGLLIIGAILLFLLRQRKRNATTEKEYLEPRQFQETGNYHPLTTLPTSFVSAPSSGSTKQRNAGPSRQRGPLTVISVASSYEPPSTATLMPASTSTAVSIAPTTAVGRNSKAREVSAAAVSPTPSAAPALLSSTPSEDSRWPPGIDQTSPGPSEVVIQHTDARGVTVRELPPPYGSQVSGPAPMEQAPS
ncbi:hypothetical protein LshimejAT787_1204280 [Lyophyllum shimeji]|uniref:Uncharacterized protein n=1 Tax=Lyophyllum shimeji TaxID=47721 RepID=A0A9P3PWQ0_LYOSH|nr:hypothetical protein LshimejAT787_1204280 [Lyophyllum shimeji]